MAGHFFIEVVIFNMIHYLPRIGIIRAPGLSYQSCIRVKKNDINIKKAIKQHQIYADTLSGLGIDLIRLRPMEGFPDSCFVEDTVVVIEEKAIICRLKYASRRGEEDEIAGAISGYKEVFRVKKPATLEGGDILDASDKIYVGRSSRANDYGIGQLRKIIDKKKEVITVDIGGALHLKSVCTIIDEKTILIREGLGCKKLFKGYRFIEVPYEEKYAANSLAVMGRIIIPKGYPITKERIKRMGYEVIELDISEFEKGDGGLTCLSILF